jgi:hypothetical protein
MLRSKVILILIQENKEEEQRDFDDELEFGGTGAVPEK